MHWKQNQTKASATWGFDLLPVEIEVDGSILTFPAGWQLEKLDDWPEQSTLTQPPFYAKGCDLVAMKEGTLWLIEVKDYTYQGAKVPANLAETVGLKIFHSLAVLHSVARWGDGPRKTFSKNALNCDDARVCLALELPDGGRRLIGVSTPLAGIFDKLKKVTRKLRVYRPVISNSHQLNGVPWNIKRNPETRGIHADR